MADGMFEDLTQNVSTDPSTVRKLLMDQQQAQLQKFANKPRRTKREEAGAGLVAGLLGLAQSGAFGEKAKSWSEQDVNSDPTFKQAQSNADLAQQIQELGGDPSTADFAAKAATLAHQSGRPDLALKYRQIAGERAKAEATASLKQAAEKQKQAREKWSMFPTSVQEEIVAQDPSVLTKNLGLPEDQAKQIGAAMVERNNLEKAKMQAALNKVKDATTTKTSGEDVKQIKAELGNFGIDAKSFGLFGDNTEEFDRFATPIAGEVQKRLDEAKNKGERLSRTEVLGQIIQELKDAGAINLEDRTILSGKKLTIDGDAFTGYLTGGVMSQEARDAADWIKANPNDPRVDSIKQHYGLK
jgi:hypothetical protein